MPVLLRPVPELVLLAFRLWFRVPVLLRLVLVLVLLAYRLWFQVLVLLRLVPVLFCQVLHFVLVQPLFRRD
jgi:hypothetical protein